MSTSVDGAPTRFEDLNGILAELAMRAGDALGDNFVGMYLVGSFALDEADEHSDVDFLVVTNTHVTSAEVAELRAIHADFPDRPMIWAQHLEGSYPPSNELRTLRAIGSPWLYVDNGAKEMERSTHCNTAAVRWTLRERGIVVTGPSPHTLVEPITAHDLRTDARRALDEYVEWVHQSPAEVDDAWAQPYVVITFSRIMYTIATGMVAAKKTALEWARETTDERWTPLIDSALADRPDPWSRVGRPARGGTVEPTLAFADHVAERCGAMRD